MPSSEVERFLKMKKKVMIPGQGTMVMLKVSAQAASVYM